MDTTQMNREETARRKRPEGSVSAPASAQQNNGAVRAAQAQADAAGTARRAPKNTQAPEKNGEKSRTQQRPQRPAQEKKPAARNPQAASSAPVKKPENPEAEPVWKTVLEEEPRKAAQKSPEQKKPAATQKAPAAKAQKAPVRKKTAKKKTSFAGIFAKPQRPEKPEVDVPDKKRSYGNSKPKKTSSIQKAYQQISGTGEAAETKKKKKRASVPAPAVIYTQPEAFNRNRLLIQLASVAAIVAAMVFGVTVFFKVETIQVSGTEVYTPAVVVEYSGIEKGDSLLTFSRPRAGAMIKANLPYVDTVRFGIKLPGTVNIIIEEDDVVYSIKDQDEAWWLINSEGRVVEKGKGAAYANHTQVLGVTIQDPVADTAAVAAEPVRQVDPTAPTTEFIPVTTTNSQRLAAALEILQALEANDIVGAAASVNVERLNDIILWYGSRYQVNLGDNQNLAHKIATMNAAITQLRDYQSGILDVSFTIWPDKVGFTPFG